MAFEKRVIWSLFDAKAKLSALVDAALSQGPQLITRRGKPAVVVVAADDYERLVSPKQSFKDYLRSGPSDALDIQRIKNGARPVDL
ncbi:MAG: type II toxin-antitoxin system Phd/YefM family antitoxin [Alphaproteobacteria bacterium]